MGLRREELMAGIGLVQLLFGRKRRRMNRILFSVSYLLSAYDDAKNWARKLERAANNGQGVELTPDEVLDAVEVMAAIKGLSGQVD